MLIFGVGVVGLFCVGCCGGKVLIVDYVKVVGEKICIFGGGWCNFINFDVMFVNYFGENLYFYKFVFVCYIQWDFIDLVSSYGIVWYEKMLG